MDINFVNLLEKDLEQQIEKLLYQKQSSKQLGINGDIVAFIASCVVLPIVLSLVSSVLYDKYKKLVGKDDAQRARKELENIDKRNKSNVSDHLVRENSVAYLEGQGLSRADSERIVDDLFQKARDLLNKY